MSQHAVQFPPIVSSTEQAPRKVVSFIHHAKLISALTLASRILGVLRESLAARIFGAGMVSTAFTVAFTIPNLFRRLFGEGALSAAFIPLYSKTIIEANPEESRRFAAASVKLLAIILLVITIVGEFILFALSRFEMRPEYRLAVRLTAIMLPYVMLVCGTAFLGAILQVHKKFGLTAAAPILLNIALIATTLAGAILFDTSTTLGQLRAIYLVSVSVLIAGIFQLAILIPSLRSVGFRFDWRAAIWTPTVRNMLILSIPVAIGAGVLQLSVLLDRGISFFLTEGFDHTGHPITHFSFLGNWIRYPMEYGAAARLGWAQYLYQFPLGVFAIALATAIFPTLSADALEHDREKFRDGLRRGIQVTLWEGLPASIGLILVAQPAVQLLFERGQFTPHDTELVARSVRYYSIAIWAFSLQQILNRAFYALHDTKTPLVMSIITLIINLAVEIPLLWTPLAESAMAVGTSASFMLQCVVMLIVLQRKTGSLELHRLRGFVLKLLIATAAMTLACILIQSLPFYPSDTSKNTALLRLLLIMGTGATVYIVACALLGIGIVEYIIPRRPKSPSASSAPPR